VRLGEQGRRRRFEQSFWLLVLPITIALYLLFGALQLVRADQADGLITVSGAFLSVFAVSLRNSWRLVSVPRAG
jgi:hypothetical protein